MRCDERHAVGVSIGLRSACHPRPREREEPRGPSSAHPTPNLPQVPPKCHLVRKNRQCEVNQGRVPVTCRVPALHRKRNGRYVFPNLGMTVTLPVECRYPARYRNSDFLPPVECRFERPNRHFGGTWGRFGVGCAEVSWLSRGISKDGSLP